MIAPEALLLAARLAAAHLQATPPPATPEVAAAEPGRVLPAAPAVPADDQLEASGAVIDRVEVRIGDVFDPEVPGEDRMLFRLANRLHRTTREGVIRSQLLFAAGDPYSRRVLDESERLLRGDRYLYDAAIRPVRVHDGNRVDVEVDTRDVWTLEAGFGFGRKGGVNTTRFKVEDINVFGTGKRLAVEHTIGVDRTGTELSFFDPNLLGGRGRLDVGYSANSDGSSWRLDAGRPFFALDSRWAADLGASDDDRVDRLYLGGKATDGFRHRRTALELSGGLSAGLRDGKANRWTAGLTYLGDRFAPLGGETAAGAPLPADRTLAYPWIGFEHVEDAYVEETDLDQLGRTEDRFVGRGFNARLGWSSPLWGGEGERLIFDLGFHNATELPDRQLVDLEAHACGRWGSGGAEDLLIGGSAAYHRRDFGRHVFYAALSADAASRLDLDHQLLLGGDNGLRGYPLRYQDGDRRLLLTVEQRLVTDFQPFHLVRVGAAVFFDAGRAWFTDGGGADRPGGGLLTDIGAGLRLGHLRSAHGSVVHLDVAFPLGGDGSIASPQWLISTRKSF